MDAAPALGDGALLLAQLHSRALDVRTVVAAALDGLATRGRTLDAVVAMRAAAMADAESADSRIGSGGGRPLDGLPLGVKDVFGVAGMPTSAGCAEWSEGLAGENAAVVQRLSDAGCIVVAKLATSAFAFAEPVSPGAKPARNPWDQGRYAGGTSGGSAAAVAADLLPLALATDSAGSARIPAAHCGVTGFKPSRALLPSDGVLESTPSLDSVGLIARTAEHIRFVLGSIGAITRAEPMNRVRVGVLRARFEPCCSQAATTSLSEALEVLRALGADLVDVEFEAMAEAGAIGTTIAAHEFARAHARLRPPASSYGPLLGAFLDRGRSLPPRAYAQALSDRVRYAQRMSQAASGCDVLVCPTVPCVAPELQRFEAPAHGGPVTWLDVAAANTLPFNLADWPAVSIPIRSADGGLPFGLQIAAPAGLDARVLAVAEQFQAVTGYHANRPPAR